mmetsp:Transcript_13101/g.36223  ORF Transcript_13101/g.36223 Transcript_13101/m.36223 type:complete len:230 (-) Transcript_13101:75-764(-)
MLLALPELALVDATVRPLEGARATPLVLHILANVRTPVRKLELSLAMHSVPIPLALVPAAVAPEVDAMAVEGVVQELAVVRATCPLMELLRIGQLARTRHATFPELGHKPGAVLEGQSAIAVLHPVGPLAPVHRATRQGVGPLAVCPVVQPTAHIRAPVRKLASAPAGGLPGTKLSDVFAAFGEDLRALAVGLVAEPLAAVSAAAGQLAPGPAFPHQAIPIVGLCFTNG